MEASVQQTAPNSKELRHLEVVPVCPLRKLRWARPGMGKRGGTRVIYFVRTAAGEVVLVVAYAKGNADALPLAFLNRLKELYDV